MIFQHAAEDCGYAVSAMLINYHDIRVSLNQIKMIHSKSGVLSAQDILTIFSIYGIQAKLFYSKSILPSLTRKPVILHLSDYHYVIAYRVNKNKIKVYDPEDGISIFSEAKLNALISGFMIETNPIKISPKINFPKLKTLTKLKPFIAFILLVLLSQILLFGSPLIIRKLIDSMINSNQLQFPFLIVGIYVLAKLMESLVEFIKINSLAKYGHLFNLKYAKKISEKLRQLSFSWYVNRSVGELFNTISSVYKLNSIFVDNIVAAIVDGIVAIIVSFILLSLSPLIFAIILISILIEWIACYFIMDKIRYYIAYNVKQKHHGDQILLENIRSVLSIRVNSLIHIRDSLWKKIFNKYGKSIFNISKYKSIYKWVRNSIVNLETLIIVILSAWMIRESRLSYGYFYIILFYKNYIHESIGRMLDKWIDYQLLEENISNVHYILTENTDESLNDNKLFKPPQINLTTSNINFQYPNTSHQLLNNFSYQFLMNKNYCIVGSSGCGKTTLLYILMGVMQPTSGIFYIDGISHRSLNNKIYKMQIASVLQNDNLFSGTLAENISLFDKSPNMNLIKEVSEIACIDHYINALPLKYHSFIDGSGNAMSGGQKQRLLLARALYKKPKILFLDEATSHLDTKTEELINNNIAELKMTKIIVAHRLETIRFCDSVIDLSLFSTK